MSDSARWHAEQAVKGKTVSELKLMIEEHKNGASWKGSEFDDARARHKSQTRLAVYQSAFACALMVQALADVLTAEQLQQLGEDIGDGLAGIEESGVELTREQGAARRLMDRVATAIDSGAFQSSIEGV